MNRVQIPKVYPFSIVMFLLTVGLFILADKYDWFASKNYIVPGIVSVKDSINNEGSSYIMIVKTDTVGFVKYRPNSNDWYSYNVGERGKFVMDASDLGMYSGWKILFAVITGIVVIITAICLFACIITYFEG